MPNSIKKWNHQNFSSNNNDSSENNKSLVEINELKTLNINAESKPFPQHDDA